MVLENDILAGITGHTEKAVIKIHDCRKAAASGSTDLKKLSNVLKSGLPPTAVGVKEQERILPVQFNPNELSITVTGDPIEKIDVQVEPGAEEPAAPKVESGTMSMGHVTLSVKLIFDRVMNQDAFMADKLCVTSVKGIKGDMAKLDNAVYSVQTEVEGLIAALQNCYTRVVTFQWSNFTFTGSLETIQANYTMFSPSGRPIRADISLDITQDGADNTLKMWRDQFHLAFSGSADLGTGAGLAEPLINLPV